MADVDANKAPYYKQPLLRDVAARFRDKYPRANQQVFDNIINYARSEGYISVIDKPSSGPMSPSSVFPERVQIKQKGANLLIPTIFINMMGEAIGKVLPVLISIAALVVSIIALTSK